MRMVLEVHDTLFRMNCILTFTIDESDDDIDVVDPCAASGLDLMRGGVDITVGFPRIGHPRHHGSHVEPDYVNQPLGTGKLASQ